MYICATSSSALCSSCEYTLMPAGQRCHHSRQSHQVINGQHSWTEAATLVTITACCCMMAMYRWWTFWPPDTLANGSIASCWRSTPPSGKSTEVVWLWRGKLSYAIISACLAMFNRGIAILHSSLRGNPRLRQNVPRGSLHSSLHSNPCSRSSFHSILHSNPRLQRNVSLIHFLPDITCYYTELMRQSDLLSVSDGTKCTANFPNCSSTRFCAQQRMCHSK